LTLRQIKVRILALPRDSDTWAVLINQHEKAQGHGRAAELEAMHARFKP
jgi:hypothetical protein